MSEESERTHPDNIALTDTSGRTLTYVQLDAGIQLLDSALAHFNTGIGARIAVLLPKSFASVIAIHAARRTGAAYIPIDPAAPESRIQKIIADADPHIIIHNRAYLFADKETSAHSVAGENIFISLLLQPNYSEETHKHPEKANYFKQLISHILYTSGSTGVPKGVVVSLDATLRFLAWCSAHFDISAEDQIASIAPFHFDLSVCDIFAAENCDATLHLFRSEEIQNPRLMAEQLSKKKITFIYATPTFFSSLLQFGKIEKYDWSALRIVLFAGEVFPPSQLHALMEHWSEAQFFNLYGPTETNVCTYHEIVKDNRRTTPYPVGRPCSNHEIEISDEGELLVGGPHVAEGYLNQPELTAQRFFTKKNKRWFRTGDKVEQDENGLLVYKGRLDRMVKRRGYRIEPAEIEAALMTLNGITGAAVVAHTKDDTVQLTAVLTGRSIGIIELKQELAQRIPDYMLPDSVIMIDVFPTTSSGKTDYVKLQQEVVSSL